MNREPETIDTSSGRLAAFVFSAALPLAAAVALLPSEFSHYKRWLELGADETALRLAVLSTIFSKTNLAILIGLGFLAVCARFVRPHTLRLLSLGISLLLLGFLGVDLELQKNTGNNISHYLPFLLDPDTFRWAGDGFDAGPRLLLVGRRLVVALVIAGALAWLLERWVARLPARRGRGVIAGLVCLTLLPLIAAPALFWVAGAPGYLYHLNERMPWTWSASLGSRSAGMEESQGKAQEIYSRALQELSQTSDLAVALQEERPAETPDILMVTVESLRYDALEPETMPRAWALSEQGVRLPNHYATSNASHYGMFALLYGRSPLRYFEVLESGEPPTLPSQLQKWGYTTHYVTCTDIHWREMDRFMGAPHFAVERMRATPLEDCDREVVARAAALLEPGDRPPRLVLAFMMSTHFGYHYPAGAERFEPSLPPPNALELNPVEDREALSNRYRNSAHYVDSLIGWLIDRVELAKTLVVVTGDHGESLFDDGTIAHSSLLSEVQTRVPLVLSGPGLTLATTHDGPTDHSDILPTLFARLGVEPKRLRRYAGRDVLDGAEQEFVPLVHAKARRSGGDRLALVSSQHRYSLRLDATRGELRFLGILGADGRPSNDSISAVDGARVVRWIDRYLEAVKGR